MVFGRDWATSPRRYAVAVYRDVRIPSPDGTVLVGDIFRPDTSDRVDYGRTDVPGYFGACWGLHGLHLPAAFRSFGAWQGPKKLVVGPPLYLDRPFYQMHHEALRWFDHWLAGNDTGFLAEPPVRLFVPGTGEWRQAAEWPLPQTRWTEFYLHQGGLARQKADPW
jgi:uncharacterized protein